MKALILLNVASGVVLGPVVTPATVLFVGTDEARAAVKDALNADLAGQSTGVDAGTGAPIIMTVYDVTVDGDAVTVGDKLDQESLTFVKHV